LSTLTKVLIILLTVFSIFLCGIVVTYVATNVNYKQKYDSLQTEYQAARRNAENADKRLNETIKLTDEQKKDLSDQISSLQTKIEQLEGQLRAAERDKAAMLQRVDGFAAEVASFSQTNENQRSLLEDTIKTWKSVEAALIKEQSQHKETAQTLLEKMAVIATLEEQNKQLLEQKTELQTKLDQLLRQYGKVIAPPTPITPTKGEVRPALPTKAIGLKGTVTAVDSKNSLAEISIGSASGVKENMKFHVIRGDEFICDILILDVDADKAVGILDLVQKQPKVGDLVSTNF
jgi:myosin heavy subunit